MTNKSLTKKNLLLTTALTTSLLGYYKRAYSDCIGTTTITCYGNNTVAIDLGEIIAATTISTGDDFSITDNGDAVIGNGISAEDIQADTSFTDTHESIIKSESYGISLRTSNSGNNNLSINVNSTITHGTYGVHAYNPSGGSNTITIEGSVNSSNTGVKSYTNGSNANHTIQINGDIEAADFGLIVQSNFDFHHTATITTGSDSQITATESSGKGIHVSAIKNTIINISGDVTGGSGADGHGVYVNKRKQFATLTAQNGANISGHIGIQTTGDTTLDGTSSAVSITGSGGTAILFNDEINQDNSLTITGDVTLDGDIIGDEGTDTLTINNSNLTLTEGSDFSNFEIANITGTNVITGDLNLSGAELSQASEATLDVSGTLTSASFAINSGATLSGNKTLVTNLTINSGGSVAPGNSVGTINVTGNTTLNSGSSFNAEIDDTGADLLAVTGDVTISSGAALNATSTRSNSGSNSILTATGTIAGAFGTLAISNSNPKIISTLHADSSSLALISLNTQTLNPLLQSSINSSILFNDTLNDQIADGAFVNNRHFWIRNINRNRNIASNASGLGFRTDSDGIALGAQMDVNNNYKLGISLSEISNKNTLKDGLGNQSDSSTFASIYGIYNRDLNQRVKLFSSLSFGIGYHDNNSTRLVSNDGVSAYAKSSSKDYEYNTTFQIGSKIKLKNNYFLTPRASASYIHNFAQGINEESGGISKISINKHDFSSLKTRESVRFGKNSAINIHTPNNLNISITPYFELGLSQEKALNGRNISGQFSNGANFNTTLEKNNRNFTTTAIGFNSKINNDISIFFNYENANSNDENRSELKAGARLSF